jgi:zinc protease
VWNRTLLLPTFALCVGLTELALAEPPKDIKVQPQPGLELERPTEAVNVNIPFERYQLKNGLTVILHQDRRLPIVAVSVWYDVGGLSEQPGRSGFAHLFEHMMFQNSPNVGEDRFFPILQDLGGSKINGTTSYDRTNYFETVPSNTLETVLWMESDRMGFLLDSITDKSLANQKDVVQNERRQSVENQPYGLMSERLTKLLYPAPHPYNGDVIGSMDDIRAATRKDVEAFFKTYYTPANATLVLAGDIEVPEAKRWIEKYFGPLEGLRKPPRPKIPAPKITKEIREDFSEPFGKLPKLTLAWIGPNAFQPDNAALDVLAHVLSGTRSSRLDRRLVHDDNIAAQVSTHYQELQSGSVFQIDVLVQPGRTLEEALKAVDDVLAGFSTTPPTGAEVHRAQNTVTTTFVRDLEVLGGFSGRTERLQLYNHYLGDPGRIEWDLERYQKVGPNDVSRVLKRYLNQDRVVMFGRPQTKALAQGGTK